MLVIDDNNLKLLKMKEKLLEIAVLEDLDIVLNDYKRLAEEIDKSVYEAFINRIRKTDYHNQSLEEQLSFLIDIEEEYVEFYELQCRFKNVYEKYSNNSLNLSNIEDIKIDEIRNRISNISGYLINIKNIEDSKIQLTYFGDKLIEEEKKKDAIALKLLELDKILLDNVLKAEGRILDDMANIEYTSVVAEYDKIGIDLRLLLDDREILNNKVEEYEAKRKEKEDLLKVAEICYNNMPNENNRLIYDNIMLDAVKSRYELSLLKIADLLSNSSEQYDEAKKKREKIVDLIKYRLECLKKLGVKFSIEPFSRIRVGEQLKIIESFGDNTKEILSIRKKISEINSNVELCIGKNNVFLDEINSDIVLYEDGKSLVDFDISSVEVALDDIEDRVVQDNQVVGISIISEDFMFERALEKSSGVIKRVNEMINHIEEVEEETIEVTPELVINNSTFDNELDEEDDISFYDKVIGSMDMDDTISSEETLLSDSVPYADFVHFDDDVVLESMFPLVAESSEVNDDTLKVDDEIKVSSNDLFQEVVPFNDSVLFTDKYDDGIYDEGEAVGDSLSADELLHLNDSKEEAEFIFDSLDEPLDEPLVQEDDVEESMPDAFWVTQDEESSFDKEEEEKLSFDEQIDYLMNQDNDVKVRRKVA